MNFSVNLEDIFKSIFFIFPSPVTECQIQGFLTWSKSVLRLVLHTSSNKRLNFVLILTKNFEGKFPGLGGKNSICLHVVQSLDPINTLE